MNDKPFDYRDDDLNLAPEELEFLETKLSKKCLTMEL